MCHGGCSLVRNHLAHSTHKSSDDMSARLLIFAYFDINCGTVIIF